MMGRVSEFASETARLDGARVLVVEDDFIIGLELAAVLTDAGAEVVGPSQTVQAALARAEGEGLSAAVLDIRLGDGTVAPVARQLAERHVPFVFYTGQSKTDPLRAEWPDCQIVSKPASPASLVAAVASLLRDKKRRKRLGSASD